MKSFLRYAFRVTGCALGAVNFLIPHGFSTIFRDIGWVIGLALLYEWYCIVNERSAELVAAEKLRDLEGSK